MPVKPREFLNVAAILTEHNSEAALRSAVSRAYYSAYHHGIHTVDIKLPTTKNLIYAGGCHQQLKAKLLDGKSTAWRRIAYSVDDLRKSRILADYHLDASITVDAAKKAVVEAENIIQALDALETDSAIR